MCLFSIFCLGADRPCCGFCRGHDELGRDLERRWLRRGRRFEAVRGPSVEPLVRHGELDALKRLVKNRGTEILFLDCYTDSIYDGGIPFVTPVFLSCWYGHDHVTAFLLECEARHRKKPPYRISIYRDFAKACKLLPLSKIQVFVQHFGTNVVDPQSYSGCVTPLHHACARAHLPLIQYLLEQQSRRQNRNHVDWLTTPLACNGATALHWLGLRIHQNYYNASRAARRFARDGEDDFQLTEALQWILDHESYRKRLFVADHRGCAALSMILPRLEPMAARNLVAHLVCG